MTMNNKDYKSSFDNRSKHKSDLLIESDQQYFLMMPLIYMTA